MSFPGGLASLRKKLDVHSARWLAFALFTLCLTSGVITVAYQVTNLDKIGEVGFGDNYILNTVLRFQKTGVIYETPGASSAVPAISQYSPMLYLALSLPGRLVAAANPFVGPRILELLLFLSCVAAAASITRTLVPHASAWRWSVLLSLSIEASRGWMLQLRGDAPAILFGLISIRLLLARWRWSVLLAGVAAGFATQFKFTYVSALIAGELWLLLQRRWKCAAQFTAGGLVASLGIYLVFLQREPQMLAQMFIFRHTIFDLRGLLGTVWPPLLREPVLLLGVATVPLIALRAWRRWWLLIAYVVISFGVSSVLNLHAGGNVNYYFEALFAMLPLAAFGVLQLSRCRVAVVNLFLTAILLLGIVLPNTLAAFRSLPTARAEAVDWNHRMTALRTALQGTHVLSFEPTVTYLAPETVISEPFLLSYLDRLGQLDPGPFQKRILQVEFDLVVTATVAENFRGVNRVPVSLRPAIAAAYQPACLYDRWTIHLPRQSPRPGLLERLAAIGCAPAIPGLTDRTW